MIFFQLLDRIATHIRFWREGWILVTSSILCEMERAGMDEVACLEQQSQLHVRFVSSTEDVIALARDG